jgi:hypothetical protein
VRDFNLELEERLAEVVLDSTRADVVHHIDQIVQAHTAMEEGRVAGGGDQMGRRPSLNFATDPQNFTSLS